MLPPQKWRGRGSIASESETEDADDAVHRFILPSHRAAPVGVAVPETGAGRV